MNFKSAKELLELCKEYGMKISEVMRRRETTQGEMPGEEVHRRMVRVMEIMKDSARAPIQNPVRSMGGLIGGEACGLPGG